MTNHFCSAIEEVSSRGQAIAGAIHTDACLLVEAFLVYHTVFRFLRREAARSDPYFWVMFGLAHAAVLLDFGQGVSGLVCVGQNVYDALQRLSFMMTSMSIVCFSAKACNTLAQLNEINAVHKVGEKALWGLAGVYVILTGCVAFVWNNELLVCGGDAVILVILMLCSIYLTIKYAEFYTKFSARKTAWYITTVLLCVLLPCRLAVHLAEALELLDKSQREETWFAACWRGADVLCGLFPLFLLCWFVTFQGKDSINDMLKIERSSQHVEKEIGKNIRTSFDASDGSEDSAIPSAPPANP